VAETILLVDDDPAFRAVYERLLRAEGHAVSCAEAEPQAIVAFERSGARIVLLDLMLPPSGKPEAGAAILDRMLRARPDTKVVVVSGAGEGALALDLVRRGAYDFLAKPVDPEVLLVVVARAEARLRLEDRVRELERASTPDGGLLGQSAPFVAARTLAERAAATDVPVLITGPSGTGKELFARFIHDRSGRASRAFVAINCGALAPSLLEATLFGHKRGAFTGATSDARGLFVEADGGTLFLDELGDLELSLQVKLLRALESGEILPVGASKAVQTDVRIVSATHRPLAEMVAARAFRDDLYWRVRGIEIELPSLAERVGDLPVLAQHFANQARAIVPGARAARISPSAMRRLEAHGWPGNLRELRHEIQRALVMAAGREEILEEDLSPALRAMAPKTPSEDGATLEEKIEALERREIARALEACAGNRSQAAAKLGLSRQGLLNKMARFGMR
jgi:DNA-binding NtrC family response regulator